jgi:hypothetical protein
VGIFNSVMIRNNQTEKTSEKLPRFLQYIA